MANDKCQKKKLPWNKKTDFSRHSLQGSQHGVPATVSKLTSITLSWVKSQKPAQKGHDWRCQKNGNPMSNKIHQFIS